LTDLELLSLTEASDAVATRRASSVELTKACLDRIATVQPKVNCFISVEADAALVAAARADREVAADGPRGPLHGIPLAHKDMFYREGEVSSFGSRIFRDYVPGFTATVMERIDAAGAVYLGSLNMAEFATGPVGQNDHFGAIRNPWTTDHISGGSSSGSGAAVAARLCFGSLGSDTGGSCRLPAGMCGVIGVKPTYGLVSRYGGMPRCWSLDVFGPLARTAEDAAVLLQAVAGHDPRDSTTGPGPVPDYRAALARAETLRGVKIGVPTNHLYPDAHPALRPALEAALSVLEDCGATLVDLEMPDPEGLYDLTNIINKCEAAALHDEWIRNRPDDYSVSVRSRMEAGYYVPATRYIQALRLRPRIVAEFCASVFGKADVLFTPVISIPVPRIEEATITRSADAPRIIDAITMCTRWVSYLGVPAVSVPCGFTDLGLPVGYQLLARPFAEELLLRVAHLYQQATDWHRRVPPV
jgi:aspartyl-tRNA(Asn)/glutamyl-tRNA(Gln) amidotransferase subunit A